jgi:hypothetical protein
LATKNQTILQSKNQYNFPKYFDHTKHTISQSQPNYSEDAVQHCVSTPLQGRLWCDRARVTDEGHEKRKPAVPKTI